MFRFPNNHWSPRSLPISSEPGSGGDAWRAFDGARAVLLDHDVHRRRNGRGRHPQSQVSTVVTFTPFSSIVNCNESNAQIRSGIFLERKYFSETAKDWLRRPTKHDYRLLQNSYSDGDGRQHRDLRNEHDRVDHTDRRPGRVQPRLCLRHRP